MAVVRIALGNLRFPSTPDESISLVVDAIGEAARERASVIAFPECYVPGYRGETTRVPPPSTTFLERAWAAIAAAAPRHRVAVVLGTERLVGMGVVPTVLVIGADGSTLGFQDKVQIDPSEERTYTPGNGRQVFTVGALTFGVAICHEGWRYPETVRFAARRGAHVVFHPHFHAAEPGGYRPSTFGDPQNSFHEKAMLCRAAENTCYFASVNYASEGSPSTSAVVKPDGTVLVWQPYGREGLLVADVHLAEATGLLAKRLKE